MQATNGRKTAEVVEQDEEGVALRWDYKGAVYGLPFEYTSFYTWDELNRYGISLDT